MNIIPDGYTVKEVVGRLDELRHNQGWILLKKLLQSDIDGIEKMIWDTEQSDIHEVNRLKDRRAGLLNIMDLPQDIITQLLSTHDIPDDDPYEKTSDHSQQEYSA